MNIIAAPSLSPRYDAWLTEAPKAAADIQDFDTEWKRIEDDRRFAMLATIKDASIDDCDLTNVCEQFDMTASAMRGVFAAALSGQYEQAGRLMEVLLKQAIKSEADRHATHLMNK